jgi:twitching motility protein PilT
MIRVDGDLRKINLPPLDAESTRTLITNIMNDDQKKIYKDKLEIDLSVNIPNVARFRVNAFTQERGPSAVFRAIPPTVPTFDQLALPPVIKTILEHRNGLVLVTGPTGSGKTTTLAAMIDYLNSVRYEHIITIEDPIEFVHQSKKCLINQREVHEHTLSFNTALRSALREDPDIILVGEMRDIETIRLAITAAETGHLVFATLHTNSAAKTVNRIIDVFPASEQPMIRSMVSESLQAVISQALIKRVNGGRVAAMEIMICTPAIRNLIREDKIAQMYSAIQTSHSIGMQTMDMDLKDLVTKGIISKQSARYFATNKDSFI